MSPESALRTATAITTWQVSHKLFVTKGRMEGSATRETTMFVKPFAVKALEISIVTSCAPVLVASAMPIGFV